MQISDGLWGGKILLRNKLDYETSPSYTLRLSAKDQPRYERDQLETITNVVIQVQDVQDQPPAFINAPYSLLIQENTPTVSKKKKNSNV